MTGLAARMPPVGRAGGRNMPNEIAETQVYRLSMANPGDVSELAALFDAGTLDPQHVAAVIGKTEGNGGVNDFTRGFFTQSLMLLLGERLKIAPAAAAERVPC